MRHLNFKTKTTIWYTILIFVSINFIFSVLLFTTRNLTFSQNEETLKKAATFISQNLTKDRFGFFTLNVDFEDAIMSNITYAIYSPSGKWIAGNNYQLMRQYKELMHPHRKVPEWMAYTADLYFKDDYVGKLSVVTNIAPHIAAMQKFRGIWTGILLPMFLLSILIAYLLSGKAVKPIQDITKAARKIAKGDYSQRIDSDAFNNNEVNELVNTFNKMMYSIQQSFDREKQFTSDASHEMKTPVAVILAAAEDAKNDDTIETYRQSVDIMYNKAKHLQKLIGQLLMLATENEQSKLIEYEDIPLKDTMESISDELLLRSTQGISINNEIDENLIINTDLMLFTGVIINLLNNGLKYGKMNGAILVKAHEDNGEIIIEVSDNGIGIDEKDLPFIFDRFYRTDESRTDASSGLGLSFVKMALGLMGGTIIVTSKLGEGSCFTIRLPREHS